jgi:repressor LexA
MLTARQQAIFDFILEFRRSQGCSPSIPEIQRAFLIRSPNGVVGHLIALEAKGLIRRSNRGSRQIDLVEEGVPVRSPVHGFPLWGPATSTHERVTLDGKTLGFQPIPGTFAFRAPDDSMVAAGIHAGDLLILDPSNQPEIGQIVLAEINDTAILRRVVKIGGKLLFQGESGGPQEWLPYVPDSVRGVARLLIHRLS